MGCCDLFFLNFTTRFLFLIFFINEEGQYCDLYLCFFFFKFSVLFLLEKGKLIARALYCSLLQRRARTLAARAPVTILFAIDKFLTSERILYIINSLSFLHYLDSEPFFGKLTTERNRKSPTTNTFCSTITCF